MSSELEAIPGGGVPWPKLFWRFLRKEAFGIITTHYTNLKLLANELPCNKMPTCNLTVKSLEPFTNCILGEAGSSFTFEVAQRTASPTALSTKPRKRLSGEKFGSIKPLRTCKKSVRITKNSTILKKRRAKTREETKQLETNVRINRSWKVIQELYDTHQSGLLWERKLIVWPQGVLNNKRKRLNG